jgi:outer membrane protein OmpA-like peptidoglycan-associated protein
MKALRFALAALLLVGGPVAAHAQATAQPNGNANANTDPKAAAKAKAEAARKAQQEKRQQLEALRAQQAQDRAKAAADRQLKVQEQRQKVQQQRQQLDAERRQRLEQQKANAAQRQQEQKAKMEALKAQRDAELKRLEEQRKIKQDAVAKAREDRAAEAEKRRIEADKQRLDTQAAREALQKTKAEERQRKLDEYKRLQTEKADRAKQEAEQRRLELQQNREAATKAREDQQALRQAEREERLRKKREAIPLNANAARRAILKEQARADNDFALARKQIERAPGADGLRFDVQAATKFEDLRRRRQAKVLGGGLAVFEEPDARTIVRRGDRAFVRHVDRERLRRTARELRRERRRDGTILIVNIGFGGFEIHTIEDDYGRILRRYRRYPDGREIVIIDNRRYYERRRRDRFFDAVVALALPIITIPMTQYILDYERASEDDIYDTLMAPPVDTLPRRYALEEVRQSYALRERMRRVDLDTINFAFASWEVAPDQYYQLERMARAMKRAIDRNPDEVFMIEGHTDAVGSDIDNLSLSDRRAEEVSYILSSEFQVPPENLVTQGYGEEYLKVDTDGPSRANRRVSVRRITPLLDRDDRVSGGDPY